MNEKLYSTSEVARRVGLKRYQLDYLLETEQVPEPSLRVAGRRVWSHQELDRVASVVYEREKRKANVTAE